MSLFYITEIHCHSCKKNVIQIFALKNVLTSSTKITTQVNSIKKNVVNPWLTCEIV